MKKNTPFRITKIAFALFISLPCLVAADPNYVENTDYNVDNNGSSTTSRSYSDGLGREIQSQALDNVKGRVVITGTEYDDAGRPQKVSRPWVKNTTTIAWDASSIVAQANTQYKEPAYSEQLYYSDPIGRDSASGTAGANFSVTSHPVKQWYFGVTGDGSKASTTATSLFETNGFIKYSNLTNAMLDAGIQAELDKMATEGKTFGYYLTVTKGANNGVYSQTLTDFWGKTVRSCSYANSATPSVSSLSYDVLGNTLVETPPVTNVDQTTYNYNTKGELVSKRTPDAGTVYYGYDDAGLLSFTQDSNQFVSSTYDYYAYDNLDRLIYAEHNYLATVFNVYDDPQAVRDYIFFLTPDLDNIINSCTNTKGRLAATISMDYTVDPANGNQVVELFSYDDQGRLYKKSTVAPGLLPKETQFFYDDHDKVTSRVDYTRNQGATSNLFILSFSYDLNGRLSVINAKGSNSSILYPFARYSYDSLGHMTKKELFSTAGAPLPVYYAYNIKDWVDSITAYKGSTTIFKERLSYDKSAAVPQFNGNISRATTWFPTVTVAPYGSKGVQCDYAYDSLSRLTKVADTLTNNATISDFNAAYAYLADGRISSKKEGSKNQGSYTYYTRTNQLKATGAKTGTNFIYDGNGNMILDRSKKMVIDYNAKDLPAVFRICSAIPANLLTWNDFQTLESGLTNTTAAWEAENLAISASSPAAAAASQTGASNSQIVKFNTVPTTSNAYIQLTSPSIAAGAYTISYLYMGAANSGKVQLSIDGATVGGVIDHYKSSTTQKLSSGSLGPIMLSATTHSLKFTASSKNSSSSGYGIAIDQITFTPVTVTSQVVMTYDASGNRLKKEQVNPATNAILSGVAYLDNQVFVYNTTTGKYDLSYSSVSSEGRVMATWIREFFLKDHLGSTRAVVTDESGFPIREAIDYVAYGTQIGRVVRPAATMAREKFTSKEWDQEGGINLDYFGRRYYDPEIGTFSSTDPADQFWNSYSYCGGNPVYFTDPDGAFVPQLIGMAIGAVAGGYIGGAMQNQSLNPFEWKQWGGAAIGAVMGGFGGAMIGDAVAWALESMPVSVQNAAVAAPSASTAGTLTIHAQQAKIPLVESLLPDLLYRGAHAWMQYQQLSYSLRIPEYSGGPAVTLQSSGTWQYAGLRINAGEEIVAAQNGMTVHRTIPITNAQAQEYRSILLKAQAKGGSAWTHLKPCSDFSGETWAKITGENLAHRHNILPWSDPNVLAESINRANILESIRLDKLAELIR